MNAIFDHISLVIRNQAMETILSNVKTNFFFTVVQKDIHAKFNSHYSIQFLQLSVCLLKL